VNHDSAHAARNGGAVVPGRAMNAIDPAPTQRQDLAGLLGDLERLEALFATWDQVPRSAVEAYRRAIDALHAEALARLIRTLRAQPAALAAMKEAVGDEVVYAVLRYHELVRPSLNERVETALASVRPMLASHGGDVQVVKIEPPAIEVRLTGACDGCAASALTFQAGIRKAIQEACPEITEIVQARGGPARHDEFQSPFASGGSGTWLSACVTSEIPDGGIRPMQIGGQKFVLFRRGVAVTCFQDACAHLGLPLHEGGIEEGIITCPHHGFRYDLASGKCLTAPEVQLHMHAVRVLGDRVEVRFAT
jgi:Fe-S cluster biogenesis protein NfuA/nitrite reductase/ring-hydroxylating ferredoxin subunit